MIRSSFTLRTARPLLIVLLLTISLACNALSGGAGGSPVTPEVKIQKDITFGPGAFNFTDPRAGLADLTSYTVRLGISFEGTRDGQPEKWSKTYTVLATGKPQAKQWTIEGEKNGSALDKVFQAEMNGLDYKKQGEGACLAKTIDAGDPLSDSLEPASFLRGVIGAEQAGTQKVNNIATTHYTFDQRALGEDGLNQSTGELWVATEGAYLVKYVLSTQAGPNYFGAGVDGTMSLDYELTDPNAEVTITLPDDCPPGLVGVPPLPDATNVKNTPGVLSYDSSTSIEDAAAFYEKQVPPLGWNAEGDPAISDKAAILNYTKGDQVMTITIEAADHGSTVTVFIGQNQVSP
jgi:hypothetical protein